MTTKLTHIDKDNLIAKLRAEIVAQGTALADALAKIARLEKKVRESSNEPDRYCVTAPDGECISTDPRCMHHVHAAPKPSVSPGKLAAAAYLAASREMAQILVAQYGASNVRRVGGRFQVLTPNKAWHPVQ